MTELDAVKTLRRLLPGVSQRGLATYLDTYGSDVELPGYKELSPDQRREFDMAAYVAAHGYSGVVPPKATIYGRIRRADDMIKAERLLVTTGGTSV